MIIRAVRQRGGTVLVGEFIPTAKNAPASQFYRTHGFEPLDDDQREWSRTLDEQAFPAPGFIKVDFADV